MRRILVLPVLFLLITLVPHFVACPSTDDDDSMEGTPSSTATALQSALGIQFSDLSFNHTVGTTDCPQDIGMVTLVNNTDAEATFTTALSGDGAAFIEVEPYMGTVPAGETVVLDVSFNCGQASPFTAALQVDLTNGSKTNSQTAPITANITN